MKSKEMKTTNIAINAVNLVIGIIVILLGIFAQDLVPLEYHFMLGIATAAFSMPFIAEGFMVLTDEEIKELLETEEIDQ